MNEVCNWTCPACQKDTVLLSKEESLGVTAFSPGAGIFNSPATVFVVTYQCGSCKYCVPMDIANAAIAPDEALLSDILSRPIPGSAEAQQASIDILARDNLYDA